MPPLATQFAPTLGATRRSYREFVGAGIAQGCRPDLTGGGLRRSMRGWQHLAGVIRGRARWGFDERILGSPDFVVRTVSTLPAQPRAVVPPTIDTLVSTVGRRCRVARAQQLRITDATLAELLA